MSFAPIAKSYDNFFSPLYEIDCIESRREESADVDPRQIAAIVSVATQAISSARINNSVASAALETVKRLKIENRRLKRNLRRTERALIASDMFNTDNPLRELDKQCESNHNRIKAKILHIENQYIEICRTSNNAVAAMSRSLDVDIAAMRATSETRRAAADAVIPPLDTIEEQRARIDAQWERDRQDCKEKLMKIFTLDITFSDFFIASLGFCTCVIRGIFKWY